MDVSDPNPLFQNHEEELAAMESFTRRYAKVACGNDRRLKVGMEMIARDLDLTVSTEAHLGKFIAGVAKGVVQKSSSMFEKLSAWFDSTGTKELVLLERQIKALIESNSQPTTRNMAMRDLADSLQIDGALVTDHFRQIQSLVVFGQDITDHYAPALLDYAQHVYDHVEGADYFDDPTSEHLDELMSNVMAEVARRGDPMEWARRNGRRSFVGSRTLFELDDEPARVHPFSKRLRDPDSEKVIQFWMNRQAALSSQAAVRDTNGTARIGVVPVLTLQDMLTIIEALRVLIDQVDRADKIFRDLRRRESVAGLVTFFSSLDEWTERTIHDVDGAEIGKYFEDNGLDETDRARIKLLSRYLGEPGLDPSRVVTRLAQLYIAVRSTYVRYIKISLKQYR